MLGILHTGLCTQVNKLWSLYFKYYHFVLSVLQKVIFTHDFVKNLKIESTKHKSININVKKSRLKNMVELIVKSIREVFNKIIDSR